MKKQLPLFLFFLFCFIASVAFAAAKTFKGSGEVVDIQPVFSRVTIAHKAIPGFRSGSETELTASDAKLLDDIDKGDLVDFEIVDDKGDVRLEAIKKTGVAPAKEEPHLGQMIQDTLVGTGEAVKTVTGVVPPAGEAVGGALNTTTDATGSVLNNADSQVKKKF